MAANLLKKPNKALKIHQLSYNHEFRLAENTKKVAKKVAGS